MNQDLKKIENAVELYYDGILSVKDTIMQIDAIVNDAKAKEQTEAIAVLGEKLTADFCDDILGMEPLANVQHAFETYVFEAVEKVN